MYEPEQHFQIFFEVFDIFRKVSVSVEYLVVTRMHDDSDRLGLCFWFRPTVAFRNDSEQFFQKIGRGIHDYSS